MCYSCATWQAIREKKFDIKIHKYINKSPCHINRWIHDLIYTTVSKLLYHIIT